MAGDTGVAGEVGRKYDNTQGLTSARQLISEYRVGRLWLSRYAFLVARASLRLTL